MLGWLASGRDLGFRDNGRESSCAAMANAWRNRPASGEVLLVQNFIPSPQKVREGAEEDMKAKARRIPNSLRREDRRGPLLPPDGRWNLDECLPLRSWHKATVEFPHLLPLQTFL